MKTLFTYALLVFSVSLFAQSGSEVAPPPPPPPPPPPTHEGFISIAQEYPRFPGCEEMTEDKNARKKCSEEKMIAYIAEHLEYPKAAKKNKTEGMVVVSFVVEKDGTLSKVKVVRDIGDGCGEEAKRVVESMITNGVVWIPGSQRNKVVKVQYNLPVKFNL